ncbi:uncharacterized protein AAG666_007736 [Megaptera novaeangliae]
MDLHSAYIHCAIGKAQFYQKVIHKIIIENHALVAFPCPSLLSEQQEEAWGAWVFQRAVTRCLMSLHEKKQSQEEGIKLFIRRADRLTRTFHRTHTKHLSGSEQGQVAKTTRTSAQVVPHQDQRRLLT